MVAKAGFSILGGNAPRIWPRPGSLLLFERSEKEEEFGDEVAPWRHLEQVARGSFHVKSPKRESGWNEAVTDQTEAACLLGAAAGLHVGWSPGSLGEIRKEAKV